MRTQGAHNFAEGKNKTKPMIGCMLFRAGGGMLARAGSSLLPSFLLRSSLPPSLPAPPGVPEVFSSFGVVRVCAVGSSRRSSFAPTKDFS